jgi:hypothetical protein
MLPEQFPYFSPLYFPTLPTLALSEAEKQLIESLQMRSWRYRSLMLLTDAYYKGEQVITNLGIAIPPELELLRTLVGWPRIAVDPLVERMNVEGFRVPSATDVDDDLGEVWQSSHMDAEQAFAFTDAFALGRGWFSIGSSRDSDVPVICVESPLNIAAKWDAAGRRPVAALQTYWQDDRWHAALYSPDQTVYVDEDDDGAWKVTGRDQHNFGLVPLVRLANAARTTQRDGASEITPEVRSITDAACRTLLGLEVAREFYSVPQKVILGASEEDFQSPDGTQKTAWDAYINKILALERDEQGNLPTLHQWTPYDPSVFTKIIEMLASQMGGILGAPAQELGIYTQGNPVSADAQQVAESRRDRKARHKQKLFNGTLVETMQIASRFMNNGDVPDKYRRLAVDWTDPAMFNIAGSTDAITKQVTAGMVPPTSDVALKRVGYSPAERAQLAQDRKTDVPQQELAEVASSLEAKQARTAKAIDEDLASPVTPSA